MSRTLLGALILMGFGTSSTAFAVPFTFDFTAVGGVCTFVGFGNSNTCSNNTMFTGSVTYEIVGTATSPGLSGKASSINGWVNSYFEFKWDAGSYVSVTVPAAEGGAYASSEFQSATVQDNFGGFLIGPDLYRDYFDGIDLFRKSSSFSELQGFENYAAISLWSRDLTWITGLDFPTILGMPPASSTSESVREFEFADYTVTNGNRTGFRSIGTLTSITPRTTTVNVSEPGSAALMGFAIVGLWVRRRSLR